MVAMTRHTRWWLGRHSINRDQNLLAVPPQRKKRVVYYHENLRISDVDYCIYFRIIVYELYTCIYFYALLYIFPGVLVFRKKTWEKNIDCYISLRPNVLFLALCVWGPAKAFGTTALSLSSFIHLVSFLHCLQAFFFQIIIYHYYYFFNCEFSTEARLPCVTHRFCNSGTVTRCPPAKGRQRQSQSIFPPGRVSHSMSVFQQMIIGGYEIKCFFFMKEFGWWIEILAYP